SDELPASNSSPVLRPRKGKDRHSDAAVAAARKEWRVERDDTSRPTRFSMSLIANQLRSRLSLVARRFPLVRRLLFPSPSTLLSHTTSARWPTSTTPHPPTPSSRPT